MSEQPHTRVTRDDWLRVARVALVDEGVDRVRIAVLAEQLGVARSSFYWYFRDREQLLLALLESWESANTDPLIERAERPARTVTEAILSVFECWADPALFDLRLESAIRDWARRDGDVRSRLAEADRRRLAALAHLHVRFGCPEPEATVRARVQYHSQLGLFALGVDEDDDERLRMVPAYLRVFSGEDPSAAELARFTAFVRALRGSAR